ncbi:LytR family transcriptional attenuator [Micromonospora pisi]|uniref:LytR family transcriptional attenuator n=1 Tax=Micromonospora pisi TaxID=589240 RepID=A0A495JB29_9ACTN|nr:LCP family protein [Micromonospora pisi]RKR86043.1 LytR family transcriptional attenuator [Micromonospora pisi]
MTDVLSNARPDGEIDNIMTGSNARPEEPSDAPVPETRTNRWARRLRRLGLASVILLSAGMVGVLATGYLTSSDLTGRITRVGEVFGPMEAANRPVSSTTTSNGRTILAVGAELGREAPSPAASSPTDHSEPGPADGSAEPRPGESGGNAIGQAGTERVGEAAGTTAPEPAPEVQSPRGAVMMIRFTPDQNSVAVVSIPDRIEVDVPGHGVVAVGAAHALGGPPLLIRTVERYTSVRIDHFMVIDFEELATAVDVLGGVDVAVAADVTDRNGIHFRAGVNHLDAERARAYLRQPDELPDGTVDRSQRQQNLLRALLTKAASIRFDVNPLENYRLLNAVTRAVSVDDRFTGDELRDLARSAALVEAHKIWFLTAPAPGASEGEGVPSDGDRSSALWRAFHTGTLAQYVAEEPESLLFSSPR